MKWGQKPCLVCRSAGGKKHTHRSRTRPIPQKVPSRKFHPLSQNHLPRPDTGRNKVNPPAFSIIRPNPPVFPTLVEAFPPCVFFRSSPPSPSSSNPTLPTPP